MSLLGDHRQAKWTEVVIGVTGAVEFCCGKKKSEFSLRGWAGEWNCHWSCYCFWAIMQRCNSSVAMKTCLRVKSLVHRSTDISYKNYGMLTCAWLARLMDWFGCVWTQTHTLCAYHFGATTVSFCASEIIQVFSHIAHSKHLQTPNSWLSINHHGQNHYQPRSVHTIIVMYVNTISTCVPGGWIRRFSIGADGAVWATVEATVRMMGVRYGPSAVGTHMSNTKHHKTMNYKIWLFVIKTTN